MTEQVTTMLDRAIADKRLLNHPFYQAWSMGTLSKEKLALYAEEYGAFISLLPMGWATVGDTETVEEEKEHMELWERFAEALNTKVTRPKLAETKVLMQKGTDLFSKKITALGALYAFEVQQPETAASKLDGLKKFYDLGPKAEKYFEEHTHNQHESIKLEKMISSLAPADQNEAVHAAGIMSGLLWDALTGIYA